MLLLSINIPRELISVYGVINGIFTSLSGSKDIISIYIYIYIT